MYHFLLQIRPVVRLMEVLPFWQVAAQVYCLLPLTMVLLLINLIMQDFWPEHI